MTRCPLPEGLTCSRNVEKRPITFFSSRDWAIRQKSCRDFPAFFYCLQRPASRLAADLQTTCRCADDLQTRRRLADDLQTRGAELQDESYRISPFPTHRPSRLRPDPPPPTAVYSGGEGGFASLTMGFCVCVFICLYVYTFICLYVYTFICLYVYMFYPFPFPFPFPFP